MHLRESRFGGAGPRVLAQPLDIRQPKDEVSTRRVRDHRMRPAVEAEYAVRIGVELLGRDNREIRRGRAVACLLSYANAFVHGPVSVS
jgi:hypothetical protein